MVISINGIKMFKNNWNQKKHSKLPERTTEQIKLKVYQNDTVSWKKNENKFWNVFLIRTSQNVCLWLTYRAHHSTTFVNNANQTWISVSEVVVQLNQSNIPNSTFKNASNVSFTITVEPGENLRRRRLMVFSSLFAW